MSIGPLGGASFPLRLARCLQGTGGLGLVSGDGQAARRWHRDGCQGAKVDCMEIRSADLALALVVGWIWWTWWIWLLLGELVWCRCCAGVVLVVVSRSAHQSQEGKGCLQDDGPSMGEGNSPNALMP